MICMELEATSRIRQHIYQTVHGVNAAQRVVTSSLDVFGLFMYKLACVLRVCLHIDRRVPCQDGRVFNK